MEGFNTCLESVEISELNRHIGVTCRNCALMSAQALRV